MTVEEIRQQHAEEHYQLLKQYKGLQDRMEQVKSRLDELDIILQTVAAVEQSVETDSEES